MIFHYHVTGKARKELAFAIAKYIECDPIYMKAPSFAYRVGGYTVSKDGDVEFDDWTDSEEVEMLVEALMEEGFEPEAVTEPEPQAAKEAGTTESSEERDAQDTDLVVSFPMDGFDDGTLRRLNALIAGKRTLLQKALDVDALPVEVTKEQVCFPWFHGEMDADHVQAYTALIEKLCTMAKNSKRVTIKDKDTDNAKYAFRCFLLRLGFIGNEFKRDRKILLEKLDGSGAFRNGAPTARTSPALGAEDEVNE